MFGLFVKKEKEKCSQTKSFRDLTSATAIRSLTHGVLVGSTLIYSPLQFVLIDFITYKVKHPRNLDISNFFCNEHTIVYKKLAKTPYILKSDGGRRISMANYKWRLRVTYLILINGFSLFASRFNWD